MRTPPPARDAFSDDVPEAHGTIASMADPLASSGGEVLRPLGTVGLVTGADVGALDTGGLSEGPVVDPEPSVEEDPVHPLTSDAVAMTATANAPVFLI